MFTTLLSLSLFITLIHTVVADLSIDTPALVQCQPSQITWTDSGNPPYDLLIVSAQDMCGEALEDLGNQTSTAVTWTVNLAGGTEVALSLEDAVGNEAWSGTITIGNSNDTSCLAGAPSSAAPTTLTVPPSGSPVATSSSPTSSVFAPAGAANAGLGSTSGALSTRPLGAVTLFSSVAVAAVAFAL